MQCNAVQLMTSLHRWLQVGYFFNKIQCFCFEEQRLRPGESIDMPVFFYIDPEFATDRRLKNVDHITLSYVFFKTGEVGFFINQFVKQSTTMSANARQCGPCSICALQPWQHMLGNDNCDISLEACTGAAWLHSWRMTYLPA